MRHFTFALPCLLAVLVVPARGADPLKYVPNDADLIISLDVHGLLDSAVVKKHAPALAATYGPELVKMLRKDDPLWQKLLKESDESFKNPAKVQEFLDSVKKQVSSVLLASKTNGEDNELLFAFQVTIDAAQLDALVKIVQQFAGDQIKITKVGDQGLHEVKLAGDDEAFYFALVETGTIMVTPSKAWAEEAMAKAAGKKKTELGKPVKELLDRIDRKQTLWLAAVDEKEKLHVTAGISVTEHIKARLVLTAADALAVRVHADDLSEELKAIDEMLDAFAEEHKELKPLVEHLKLVQMVVRENRISLEVEFDAKLIDKVLKK